MKHYGLIGEKLGHSYSKTLHGLLGDYAYELMPMPPQALEAFMTERAFDGVNVTIPYKQAVIPYCAELSESARRIGINVRGVQFFIYVYVGVLAGLAGVIHASMARVANPFDLVGLELSVIAAVVLGGARLAGGHGTLTGTILGVALIVLVRNSLIVLGIPATWQSVTIGLLILLGTGLPAWQAKRAAARAA